ncbi:MAG: hypothetical protein ABJ360_11940 [Roseobacter sp.]
MLKLMRRLSGKSIPPECHKFTRAGHEFGIGDDVVFTDGPFIDFPAKVVDIQGADARVSTLLFGKERVLEVPTLDIGRV